MIAMTTETNGFNREMATVRCEEEGSNKKKKVRKYHVT